MTNRDVIHGLTFEEDYTYEEFCKHINLDEIYDFLDKLSLSVSSKLKDSLECFFEGRKRSDKIMHCDTYLRENNKWRIQLHIHIPTYPEIVQLYMRKGEYMISYSGNDAAVLTFYADYV